MSPHPTPTAVSRRECASVDELSIRTEGCSNPMTHPPRLGSTPRRWRRPIVTLFVISLLAAGIATATPAAASQPVTVQAQQTDWYVNDDPVLFGPSEYWYNGQADQGYESNNFKFTYAFAGDTADNWAHWYMGRRIGRQEVSVFVPHADATATVVYEVTSDNGLYTLARLSQANASGWTTLGTWNFNGGDVVIVVADNEASPPGSKIGVDAIAMRCVSNCSSRPDVLSTVPAVPSGLSFSSGRVMWGSVSGATSYDVRVCTNEGCVTHSEIDCCEWRFGDGPFNSIRVRAVNSAGRSGWSTRIDGPEVQVPAVPTGVHLSAGRPVWNSVPEATSYELEWLAGGALSTFRNLTCSTRCTLGTNFEEGRIRVRAGNEAGWSSWSGWVDVPLAATAPSQPRNVDAVAHAANQIRVAWSPPSDSGSAAIRHYRVRYSRPAIGNSPAWSGSATTTGTSHTSGNLRYGTTYTVTVTAVNRDDLSSGSATDTVTTRARATTAPSQPRNADAVAHAANQIRVAWSPPSDSGSAAIRHYRVRYSRPAIGNSPAWSGSATTTGTSHTSGNLRYGTTYTVTVTAVNRDDLSSGSATDTVTTRARATTAPSQPRNVDAVAHAANQIRVAWSPPSDSGSAAIRHYRVRYSRPAIGNSPAWNWSTTTTGTSHTRSGLRANTTYTVTVTAVNRDDLSSRSATDTATTRSRTTTLEKVTGLEYEIGRHETRNGNLFSVDSISWDRVSGATSYELEWEYPDPAFKNTADADAQCRGERCSATFLRNPDQRYVEVRVRARSGSRTGPWSDKKRKSENIDCDATRRDTRWTPRVVGLLRDQIRIYATKDFRTTDGDQIREGAEGGKISGPNTISTRGCSWIFKDATVLDSALLSGNALVWGSAEVSGNAKVYGEARVYGKARVGGTAEVFGTARIFDDMVITSGKYDGEQEFERAARAIYNALLNEMRDKLLETCHSKLWETLDAHTSDKRKAEARKLAIALIKDPNRAGEHGTGSVEAAYEQHCKQIGVYKAIAQQHAGSGVPWDVALSIALSLAGTLKLVGYARTLIKIAGAANDLRQIGDEWRFLNEQFKELKE